MRQMKNDISVVGYLFSLGSGFNELQKRVTGPNNAHPGTNFIKGRISVATDEKAMNVVDVEFQYVPEFKKDGSPNNVYKILSDIIDEAKTYEHCGTDATMVRILGSVEANDFTNRNGEDVTSKMIRGGFISMDVRQNPNLEATFDTDILIAGVTEREVEGGEDFVQIHGYVFNFRGDVIPVTYDVHNPAGGDYFLGLDVSSSNPVLTEVKGKIISSTIEREIEEESAFGDPIVRKVSRSVRSWDVSWAKPDTYEWDDESTITKKEFKEALKAREERLAADKKRREEYLASRGGNAGFPESKPATKEVAKVVFDEEDDSDDFPF